MPLRSRFGSSFFLSVGYLNRLYYTVRPDYIVRPNSSWVLWAIAGYSGPLVLRAIGSMGQWSIGTADHWYYGPVVHRHCGPSVLWTFGVGPQDHRTTGPLGPQDQRTTRSRFHRTRRSNSASSASFVAFSIYWCIR